MNIGILTPGFSANSDDWALPFLQNLTDELSKLEDVRVIALRYPHYQQPYTINQVKVHPLGYGSDTRGLRRLQLWINMLRRLRQLHQEKPFDVLHAIWADETGLLATWVGRLLGIPSVTSVAGGELVCFPEIQYGSQCSRFGRWIVRQALKADVVTVSGSHSHGLIQQAGYDLADDKIHTVIWGVDTDKLYPEKSKKQANRLLHVGSLVGIKNQAMILRTVARLENVELDIVGDGVLRPKLEKLAYQLGIKNRVHFHGSIPYPDMLHYYQQAALHIITSHNEVVPMATLEAAACAVPTISTNVGVIADYPTIGMTVDNDKVALTKAINDLLRDNEHRAVLSQSAYETVQEHFTVQKTANTLRALYSNLRRIREK